jgi:hypothetical protein
LQARLVGGKPQKPLDFAIFGALALARIEVKTAYFQRGNRGFPPEIEKCVDFLLHCNKKVLQAQFPSLYFIPCCTATYPERPDESAVDPWQIHFLT